ncbi:arylsulfatase A-like enzyme [Aliiruegeria haliotis]|uniref:Arylsulfatase A-like enzyme n=1 Tax=Aliiruegeria haliotis TaxID=1280846 RepID=A0A2T0RFR5_9RHOB|nr:sulfatase [Aliiruegeria haliotis]PRY19950.1 arylsulfatase A-like enzyme [Aliiruegeria haliotis]
MRTVFLLFDSLNRHMLGPNGGTQIETPNFDRLAERCATLDRHYVGSMPCMPARRDIFTGRLGFLHRSWGPIEPFDICFTETLFREKGTYSHLATDHFRYWEDGGATYHSRYDSYDLIRGQEGDPWVPVVEPDTDDLQARFHPIQYADVRRRYKRQNMLNRERIIAAKDFPSKRTIDAGLAFIDRNKSADNWFLQIECFDPHEPFHAPQKYRDRSRSDWDSAILDWPRYGRLEDSPAENAKLRANYEASIRHCDALLGDLLDRFDAENLWQDTALVATTDHGFLLGEHEFWAKNRMHLYEEIAHIPLFLHDPRRPTPGQRVDALTQTPDLCATFLDLFDGPPPDTEARSLLPMLDGAPGHKTVIFGYFGGPVNITDGRYTYFRGVIDEECGQFQHTLMPTHIFDFFSRHELSAASLYGPLPFTDGVPVLRVPVRSDSAMFNTYGPGAHVETDTRLYDLATDPQQIQPIDAPEIEARLVADLAHWFNDLSAPEEQFRRYGMSSHVG